MKMSYKKTLIIDGPYTILSNQYFINDTIPRILASYIDQGYNIWLIQTEAPDMDALDNTQMPSWLNENMMILNEARFNNLKTLDFDSKSFIVSDNHLRASEYKTKLKIKSFEEVFGGKVECSYNPIDIADLIICFGFPLEEFKKFCHHSHLLGMAGNKLLESTKKNGVAILVEEEDSEENIDKTIDKFKSLVAKKHYKVKHDGNVMGATYKGQGINPSNKYIPFLYI